MSKIKSNRLEPRATNGSLTIGNPESLTAFEGDVKIPGYATEEYVQNLVTGDIAVELTGYQARAEKNVAGGYAGLDETGRVPAGNVDSDTLSEAVSDLQSDKLTKSGDEIHGSYTATEGRHLRFYGRDSNGRNKTFIDLVNTNGQGTEGTDHYLKLYHVATPAGPYHAANMKYVDDAIGISTANVLTEDEIRNIVKAHGGTPILWKYNSTVPADQLGNGEFNLSSGLSSGSADEWSIFFANRDARGQRWFPHDSGQEYTHSVGDAMATIRDRDAIANHGKTKEWQFNQGTTNYVRLKLTYFRSQFAMANGKWYLINVPGYMPFFTYSSNSYSNGTHS